MRDPIGAWPYVTDEGFPHGLRCITCSRVIGHGQPFGSRLDGMAGDGTEVVELVCVYCQGGD